MTPTLSDLRRIYYGADDDESVSDAEYQFLLDAQAAGISAVDLLGSVVPNAPGSYYAPACTAGTAVRAEGSLEVTVFDVSSRMTLDLIAGEVTVVGTVGAVFRLGIYASTSEGYPGALVVDAGTVDGTVVGQPSLAIDEILPVGRYWLGGVVQGAAGTRPTTRVNTGPGQFMVPGVSLATVLPFPPIGFQLLGIAGALPDPFGVPFGNAGTAHRVTVRAV